MQLFIVLIKNIVSFDAVNLLKDIEKHKAVL